MKVKQLSIFLENRSGRLAEITTTLGDAAINIRAMSLADTSDFGILRLIVNDVDKGRQILKDCGFTVHITEVIAVEIPDTPGSLGKLLVCLEKAGLNVEYMYVFVEKILGQAVIIFRFDDLDEAMRVIRNAGYNVLENEKLLSM